MFKVLIDDRRNDDYVNHLPIMDLIIRTPTMFDVVIDSLKGKEFSLYIDHDLGLTPDCHVERSGYKLLMDMFSKEIYPKYIYIITGNVVGRKNIEAALMDVGYTDYANNNEWSRT